MFSPVYFNKLEFQSCNFLLSALMLTLSITVVWVSVSVHVFGCSEGESLDCYSLQSNSSESRTPQKDITNGPSTNINIGIHTS